MSNYYVRKDGNWFVHYCKQLYPVEWGGAEMEIAYQMGKADAERNYKEANKSPNTTWLNDVNSIE